MAAGHSQDIKRVTFYPCSLKGSIGLVNAKCKFLNFKSNVPTTLDLQYFHRFAIATRDSITGTSIRTPTTVVRAAPD